MQAGLTNIEVGFQEYEWEEQLEKLNMEHIVFSINFLNLYLLSTDYLHTGLILLGCGLLVSSITFTAEHFLCRLWKVFPAQNVTKSDWMQIVLALSIFVPSIIIITLACYVFIENYDQCPTTFMLHDWNICTIDSK